MEETVAHINEASSGSNIIKETVADFVESISLVRLSLYYHSKHGFDR